MRPQTSLRAVPAAVAAAGVLSTTLSTHAAVAAPVAAAVPAQPAAAIPLSVKDRSLRLGQAAVVSGRLASGEAGVAVRVEQLVRGADGWARVAETATGPDGRFRVRAKLQRSGVLRAVPVGVATAASADPAAAAGPRVRVAARVTPKAVRRHVTAGRTVRVAGTLKPAAKGRTVSLQLRGAKGWRTVDRDRTDAAGRFRLVERLNESRSVPARLRFAGDATNAAVTRSLGRLNAYRSASASWYGPGLYGNPLGCGGTLTPGTVGVAHKTLPCGTKLTLRHRGHVVRTRVIDRGPFVAGREFDLTAATKAKLGFGSTGTVQVAH